MLDPHLSSAKINWAHIALASLIHVKFVRRVLSFNFDSVLARACGLLARYPAIYDFGVSPSDRTDYLADPCIVHLHGQGYGPIMLNSEEETQEHAQKLRPLIDDTFAKFPLIVVGYSGEADKVFEQIVAAYSGKYRLYWLGFEEEPKGHLRALLDGAHKNYVRYYGGADADAILIALAQKLDCFPPKAFSDPAAHLFEERTGIAEFPLGATGLKYDLLEESQRRLQHGERASSSSEALARYAKVPRRRAFGRGVCGQRFLVEDRTWPSRPAHCICLWQAQQGVEVEVLRRDADGSSRPRRLQTRRCPAAPPGLPLRRPPTS